VTLASSGDGRLLSKNVKAIGAVNAQARRTSYSIKGERGLRLVVHPTGRKVWFVVYQLGRGRGRKRRWYDVGTFPEFSLADASKEAARIRSEVVKGIDPEAPKTFEELFQMWLAAHAKKKVSTWKEEEARYNRHLKTEVGDKIYTNIERKDVGEIRDGVLERSGPIESNRVAAEKTGQVLVRRRPGPQTDIQPRRWACPQAGPVARGTSSVRRRKRPHKAGSNFCGFCGFGSDSARP